jgi:hypothetical protein
MIRLIRRGKRRKTKSNSLKLKSKSFKARKVCMWGRRERVKRRLKNCKMD